MAGGPFDTLLGDVGSRLDAIRQQLYYADARATKSEGVLVARLSKSMAYVALAAALEHFVEVACAKLYEELNSRGLALVDVRLGIVSLEQAPRFDSVAASRRQRVWSERAAVVQRASSSDTVVLNPQIKPLDGRTIKAIHLNTLWATFELPGQALPRPQLRLALEDLSEGRNDVAHGDIDPLIFGRRKVFRDVLARVDQVEELAVHVVDSLNTYIIQQQFLR